jgi:hypothetical protein
LAVRDQAGTELGEAVLAQALAGYQTALGSRLVAAYALGSLAHGGFSPLVSDVDIGLVLADPPRLKDRVTLRSVGNAVRAGGSELHQRLSVFWGTPSILQGRSRGGRFPPLDRLDLIEHGRLLAGTDVRDGIARPVAAELLVAGAEFALRYLGGDPDLPQRLRRLAARGPRADDPVTELRTPAVLLSRGNRRVTKVVLFPVRFLYTAATGQVGTNAAAVEHYLAGRTVPAAELVSAALAWRREPPANDAAAALLGQELLPLYVHYIDDHVERLEAAGSHRLAGRFRRLRARLLA